MDLRPDPAMRGLAIHRRRGVAPGAVLVGLRGAVPLGGEGRRPACRGDAAAGDPLRVKGLNRLFESPEIQAVVGVFQYMNYEVDRSDAEIDFGWMPTCSQPAAIGPQRLRSLRKGGT